MHVFTSITANYIPKARVLAWSLKKVHPDAKFHLVLCDSVPDWLNEREEPFDSVITIEELPIPDLKSWIFQHTLVEMCTGVKATAFKEIIRRHKCSEVFYFDPDIVIMSRLDSLLEKLKNYEILLTPHVTEPEKTYQAVLDNEICALKHGIYNLGFLGIKAGEEGMRFLDWWENRLIDFCFDDIPGGLFTDQRWIDMAPAFFNRLHIMREPIYNVATWNLSNRKATGSVGKGIYINGAPLCFYHFSGFDSGAQSIMLNIYGAESPVLAEFRDWYIRECKKMGQDEYGNIECKYNRFDNNEVIKKEHRLLYRSDTKLQHLFKNPFLAQINQSYLHWFQKNGPKCISESSTKQWESARKNRFVSCLNKINEKLRLKVLERAFRKNFLKPIKKFF